jgi:heavy metal sensor kinase
VYRDSFPGFAIAVYDGPRLVGFKDGLEGYRPPPPKTVDSALHYDRLAVDGKPLRLAVQQVVAEGVGSYQFVAASSLDAVESGLSDLRETFYLAIPLALAAAAIGGFLLARKSLAPVVAMSDTADQIGSKDLSQRLHVDNPKDELGRLGITLNRLLSRLEGSFDQQRQFMADSSHELRTPIYVAHTAAQVMLEKEGRSEDEYREALHVVDNQLKRLQHVVEDMFILARADSGAYPLHLENFDLGETLDESVRAARLLALRRNIQVTGPELSEIPCRGDERLIRRLLMILLDNAVKYTPDGGFVSLSTDLSDPDVYRVTVSDTGPGIPPQARPHLFERFFRVDAARSGRPGESGAGLGLAIGKWIAEVHGGSIALQEAGAKGCQFMVALPHHVQ